MQTNAINVSKLKSTLETMFYNRYNEGTEHLEKPAHRPCVVRQFPNPDKSIVPSLAYGSRTTIKTPVVETADTAILFNTNTKFYYDGLDRHINDWSGEVNPRGEHFVEELAEGKSTNKYYSIGHCPHGSIGDALLYGDIVLVITDVYLTNNRDELIPEWTLAVMPLDIEVTKH